MITVRMVKYPVPARFIGRKVRVSLRASEVVVFGCRAVAGRHPRIVAKSGQSVPLGHYLEVLRTKLGGPGQARESGAFQRMRRSGLLPGGSTATPTGHVNLSTSCCSTPLYGDATAGIVSALGWVLSVPTSSWLKPSDMPLTSPWVGPVRTGWGHKNLRQPAAYRPLPQLVGVHFRCWHGSEPFERIKNLH